MCRPTARGRDACLSPLDPAGDRRWYLPVHYPVHCPLRGRPRRATVPAALPLHALPLHAIHPALAHFDSVLVDSASVNRMDVGLPVRFGCCVGRFRVCKPRGRWLACPIRMVRFGRIWMVNRADIGLPVRFRCPIWMDLDGPNWMSTPTRSHRMDA